MRDLLSHEALLQGEWLFHGRQVSVNESCLRIEWLINNRLKKIAVSRDGWEALYVDPADNREWILYYPKSEYYGGGPPCLRLATNNCVQNNFIDYK